MDIPSLFPLHRMSRRALRRQKMRRTAFLAVSALLILWSFGAGILWHRLKSKSPAAEAVPAAVTEARRAEGMRLIDLAVEAKHDGRGEEAARLAASAREVDPSSPAADILLGEMALEQGQIDAVGPAARAALQRSDAAANAKLLLALQTWILRDQPGSLDPESTALRLLDEAAADEPANGAAHFFAGELLQATGRTAEARERLLSGLHRQYPWHSAALIAAKLQLASAEAGPEGLGGGAADTGPETSAFASAALNLQEAIRQSGDVPSALAALRSVFSRQQILVLASDPAFSPVAADLGQRAGEFPRASGGVNVPRTRGSEEAR